MQPPVSASDECHSNNLQNEKGIREFLFGVRPGKKWNKKHSRTAGVCKKLPVNYIYEPFPLVETLFEV